MSFMAERPTGALHDAEEPASDDDGSIDDAEEADPDVSPPAGWTATHFSAGGGEAQDAEGNVVIVDADGTVQTFLAAETGIADPAAHRRAAEEGARPPSDDPAILDDEDE